MTQKNSPTGTFRPVPPSPRTLERIAARAQCHEEEHTNEGEDEDEGVEAERVRAICELAGITDVRKRKPPDPSMRGDQTGNTGWYRRSVQNLADFASRTGSSLVQRTGVSSVALSLSAAVLFGATALSVYGDHLLIAATFLVAAGAVEAIDAAAAKNSPVARRDVYIDYMVDRLTDILLFGAIAVAYVHSSPIVMWFSVGTLTCSLLSSYGRAQAEALRFSTRSRFNRLERLLCVFVGLIVTAGLHIVGYATDDVLVVTLGLALLVTVETFVERFTSAIRSTPFSEVSVETWDDESFLPRLMEVLGSNEGFTIVERTAKDQIPNGGDVVFIDRYKDRTRVRIVKEAM
jgi:phosphatidylglycerophosphate synthase